MRVLILQAGADYIDLYRAVISWKGTKFRIVEENRLHFDGRVSAPKKHLMRRTVHWVNQWSGSWVKIFILPGGPLTPLLLRRVKERTLYSEILQPQKSQPEEVLTQFSQKISRSITSPY